MTNRNQQDHLNTFQMSTHKTVSGHQHLENKYTLVEHLKVDGYFKNRKNGFSKMCVPFSPDIHTYIVR